MYRFRKDVDYKINQTIASGIIGITQPALSNILTGKVLCRKVVAFCITKYLDENAEIEDYFIKEK